jgi:hypothetical protein
MTSQAYNDKNNQDYDDYTRLLDNALDKIENNPKLPATIAQIHKITGIHRNTISVRSFPGERLIKIKNARKLAAKKEKEKIRSQIDELTDERDNIAKEVVHWFSLFEFAKRDKDDFERQAERERESAEFYKKAFAEEKDKVKALEFKNEQLKELLREIK